MNKRARMVTVLLLVALVGLSVGANAELLRLTTGTSATFAVWRSSPPVFGTETYWGGLGVDLLWHSVSLSASVTLADLKTFRISQNPHFSYGISVTFLHIGAVGVYLYAGAVANPLWSPYAIGVGPGISWEPLPWTTFTISGGYEVKIRGSVGSCIYVSIGASAHIPLL